MDNPNSISVEQVCLFYQVETTFIQSLETHGLIEIVQSEGTGYIAYEQLDALEKYMHLHYELQINMEGLEAISHLLNRVQELQKEIKRLQERVQLP